MFSGFRSDKMFELLSPVQFFDETSGLAPVLTNLHEQLQVNLSSQHLFNFDSRRSSNLLQHLATMPDQNSFLPLAFAEDHCRNPREFGSLFELLDHYGR